MYYLHLLEKDQLKPCLNEMKIIIHQLVVCTRFVYFRSQSRTGRFDQGIKTGFVKAIAFWGAML